MESRGLGLKDRANNGEHSPSARHSLPPERMDVSVVINEKWTLKVFEVLAQDQKTCCGNILLLK